MSVTSNSQCQQACHGNRFGRLTVDRLADRPDGLRKSLDGMMFGHVARIEMHLRDTMEIALDEAVEDLGEKPAFLEPDPAGYAEVDGNDVAVVDHEQVARMHVGVKETVPHRMTQEVLDDLFGKFLEIVAGGAQRIDVVHLDAVDPLHRKDVATGALPIDLRDPKTGIVGRVFAHLRERGGLEPQIHLDLGRLLERLGDGNRAQPACFWKPLLLNAREQEKRLQVPIESAADARPDDLDRHFARYAVAVCCGRRMNLGNGCRGYRLLKAGVELGHFLAERAFDPRYRICRRKAFHAVLQMRQIHREVESDDIRARSEELAEFGIGRAETGDCLRHAFGIAEIAAAPARQPCCDAMRKGRRTRQALHRQAGDHALAGEHPPGADQPECRKEAVHPVRSSTRNGAPRCRRSNWCERPARNRHRGSLRRNCPDWGTCGSTRPDSGTNLRRRSPSGQYAGSR